MGKKIACSKLNVYMNQQRRDKCKRCYIHVIYPNLSMFTVNVYAIISSAVSARL